jgi:hypothetical protein
MFAMFAKPLRRIRMLLRRRAPRTPASAQPSLECDRASSPLPDPWATVVSPPPGSRLEPVADPYATKMPAPKAGPAAKHRGEFL